MNIRGFKPEDEVVLRDIHERRQDGSVFPKNIADYLVVTERDDAPLAAAGYKLIPEMTLICEPGNSVHALVKFKGIALLHQALRDKLLSCGHTEAIASVPPGLEAYRRHLQRHFGWRESWPTFRISADWEAR